MFFLAHFYGVNLLIHEGVAYHVVRILHVSRVRVRWRRECVVDDGGGLWRDHVAEARELLQAVSVLVEAARVAVPALGVGVVAVADGPLLSLGQPIIVFNIMLRLALLRRVDGSFASVVL